MEEPLNPQGESDDDFNGFEEDQISRLPTNSAMSSWDQNTVILVKPENRALFSNPVGLHKAIEKSPFHKIKWKDVRTNGKKGVIVFELEEPNKETMEKLLLVNSIGSSKYPVQCYLPSSGIKNEGVVSPVSVDADINDLKRYTRIRNAVGGDVEILKIERLKRRDGNNWVDSESVKFTFSEGPLPTGLYICYQYYKVRIFITPPMQCYGCQTMGHTAGSCKGTLKCLLCSGEHSYKDCPRKEEDSFKCANCKENHKANSKECKIIKTAWKIEKVRQTEKIPYMEARKKALGPRKATNMVNHGNTPIQTHQENDATRYRNALVQNIQTENIQTESENTQNTPTDPEISQIVEGYLSSQMEHILGKVKETIAEIFNQLSINLSNDNQQIVENILENNLNIESKATKRRNDDRSEDTESEELEDSKIKKRKAGNGSRISRNEAKERGPENNTTDLMGGKRSESQNQSQHAPKPTKDGALTPRKNAKK